MCAEYIGGNDYADKTSSDVMSIRLKWSRDQARKVT